MKRDPQSGVTLIEILVAVSLLSLLSVGMLMAMRLGFNTMDKVDAHLVANRRVVNSRGIIENEISGFVFTMADFVAAVEPVFSPFCFSQMEPQSMRFVTSYSLEDGWRGQAADRSAAGDSGRTCGDAGRRRLIVNETTLHRARSGGAEHRGHRA